MKAEEKVALAEIENKLRKPPARPKRMFYFAETRKMLRDKIRRQVGNKSLGSIWAGHQIKHSGESKLKTYTETKGV